MRESKTIYVAEKDFQRETEIRKAFGWTLVDTYITFDSNLPAEKRPTALLLERDTNASGYARLAELENQFDNLHVPERPHRYSTGDPNEPELNNILLIVLFILYIVPGVLYLIFHMHKKQKYADELKRTEAEIDDILRQKQLIVVEARKISVLTNNTVV